MLSVLAHVGNMMHAQQAARALFEVGCLDAYVTGFAWRSDSRLSKLLDAVPVHRLNQISSELKRRAISEVPQALVHTYPLWDFMRTLAQRGDFPILGDMLWEHMTHNLDEIVAQKYVPRVQAIQGFEYGAASSFRAAEKLGVARVLHLPALDSKAFEEIRRREKDLWPEVAGPNDSYFDARFQKRYDRRCEEVALADVIIVNSSLTARSHIKAGADAARVFTVPLGAPLPIDRIDVERLDMTRPLRAMWAGQFKLGKGAHHLLEALKKLGRKDLVLDIYGTIDVPSRLRAQFPENLTVHGSVPRSVLFEAYERADVLVFPTLSDGYGMVIAEAFAHGLPIITSDQAGAADMVTPQNGFVVPAGDPTALADALRWCLDNRSQLAGMRSHALAAARGRQWSHFREDLIEALTMGLKQRGYNPTYRAA